MTEDVMMRALYLIGALLSGVYAYAKLYANERSNGKTKIDSFIVAAPFGFMVGAFWPFLAAVFSSIVLVLAAAFIVIDISEEWYVSKTGGERQ